MHWLARPSSLPAHSRSASGDPCSITEGIACHASSHVFEVAGQFTYLCTYCSSVCLTAVTGHRFHGEPARLSAVMCALISADITLQILFPAHLSLGVQLAGCLQLSSYGREEDMLRRLHRARPPFPGVQDLPRVLPLSSATAEDCHALLPDLKAL